MLVINIINPSKSIICKNGPHIINTRFNIIHLFYIFIKLFLKAIILRINISTRSVFELGSYIKYVKQLPNTK